MRKAKPIIFILILVILSLTILIWIGCQKEPQGVIYPVDETQQDMSLSKEAVGDIQKVMRIQDINTDAWLAKTNVVGTATTKLQDGRYAIKILAKSGSVESTLPHQIEKIPVVVEVVGEIIAHDVYTDKYRPVTGGVSGGSIEDKRGNPNVGYGCTSGTIGCVVQDGSKKYFLSNNHVFARKNNAEIGEEIVQPGLVDVGCDQRPGDIVAYLSDFKRLKFQPLRNSNVIDAAIAEIKPGIPYSYAMASGYTPSSTPETAALGMKVKKCGRTTGLTFGEVTGVNVTIVVSYSPGFARFDDQIQFTDIADSGDSGSLIVTQSGNQPVGLEFAGSSTSSFGNPIQAVLDYFGVTVCGN